MAIKERNQTHNFEIDLHKREKQLTELIMKNEPLEKQSDSLVCISLPPDNDDPASLELIKQADSKAS